MANPVYLSAEDYARVSAAVSAAEAHTSGEIVTVLADRSDGYSDVALAWAAGAAFAALIALAIAPDFYLSLAEWLTGGWIVEWTPREIFELAAIFAVLKFAGMLLIQLWQPLKFLLIPGPIRTARVHDRAVRAFRIGAERRTHGRTGVLIYLSMREHRAEILADEAIASKVAPEMWGDAMVALLAEVKQGRLAEGMIAAVERVGAVLAEHFPAGSENANELPDRLIEV
jgi:putative membrane protein